MVDFIGNPRISRSQIISGVSKTKCSQQIALYWMSCIDSKCKDISDKQNEMGDPYDELSVILQQPIIISSMSCHQN